jgi:hypothetical protein
MGAQLDGGELECFAIAMLTYQAIDLQPLSHGKSGAKTGNKYYDETTFQCR